jgi:D-3-phosphoglycerate dehydrogenase
MYKVLIADKLPESAVQMLQKDSQYVVDVNLNLHSAELKAIITDYHAIIVRSATKVTRDIMESASALKVIGRAGTGLDNIDVSCAKEKRIEVFNTTGSNSQAVAELTIGLFFALARHLHFAMNSMKSHHWEKTQLTGTELEGKTVGLVGFGQIGQKVGKIASALGMRVLVYKPTPVTWIPGYEFELVDFDTLLTKSDYISIHIPKTEQTKNFFKSKEFNKMKKTAFLVNCARGGIVNEADLLTALNNETICGAALDVFNVEPPGQFDLIDHPRIIATPHIGASTSESQERVGQDIVKAIMNYLETKFVFISGDDNV